MNTIKTFLLVIGLFILFTGFAQNGKILNVSGLKKLSVFIGTWRSQSHTIFKDNTFAVYTCNWSANGNFLVCDQIVTNSDGKTNNLG
jgi:hypothetical protein